MNSRERVLASINHIQPDKIPIDLGSNPSSGISAIAYDNLKKHLGMNHPTLVYDVVQQLAQPDQEIIDHFGLDIIDIGRTFNTNEEDWYEYKLANGGAAFYSVWYKPQKLKSEFGNDITFWGGGIDTAAVLNNATPKEIRKHVLNRCEIFSKNGGFVFQ